MLLRVIEHGRADAVTAAGAFQHVVVAAAFASFPERVVVGQFGEGHGHIAQLGVDFHDGAAAGEAEQLGVGPAQARQGEGGALDAFGQSLAAEFLHDDEARIGHILLVAPALDVS